VLRAGVLDPLRYQWQVAYVATDPSGATTLPIATTPWRDGDCARLRIDLTGAPAGSPRASASTTQSATRSTT
jgi:hypothetical protein